ncbi:MAG: hypothetical protein EB127_16905 [Alphaproteobacteria bacterium]|nr:hypothetical protein [Alphaproteobacteria bacterium]
MALPKLEVPTYELKLPSTNKLITYRPFLVKEHKVLLTLQDANAEEVSRIIKELVDVCTFNSLKIADLANFDIEYIFLQLRCKSVGETLDLLINCECGNKIEHKANLLNAQVVKKDGHSNKIQLTQSIGIEMRYPSFDEVLKVYESENKEDIIKLVIKCIKGVYSKDDYWDSSEQTEQELINFVNDFTKEQFNKLEEFFVSMPKLEQVLEADCNKCGKHNVVKLEGLQSFFV